MYAGLTIAFWALMVPVVKLLLADLTPEQVLSWVSLFASLTMLAKMAATGGLPALARYRPRDWAMLPLLGLTGMFAYNMLFYGAVRRIAIQDAYIINYLWPVMTCVFAAAILRDRIGPVKVAAICLSFLGVAVVVTKGSLTSVRPGDAAGIAMAFGAAVSYGLYSVLMKKADYERTSAVFVCYLTSFLACLATLGFRMPAVGWVQLLGLTVVGVLSYGMADNLWALALKLDDTAKVANIAYIGPFISLTLMSVILKEEIGAYSVIGLTLIIAGVALHNSRLAGAAGRRKGGA
ncbi:MAG: DMT family transporter [Oscillospiraceae bacterium]|nr:DMT family transporter [Oscillospiraceae bacterium]